MADHEEIRKALTEQLQSQGLDVFATPQPKVEYGEDYPRGEWFEVSELPDGQVVSAREIHVPPDDWWKNGVEIIRDGQVARWDGAQWIWTPEETSDGI